MQAEILIAPANRWLAGGAHNDIANFGAPFLPLLSIHPASSNAPALSDHGSAVPAAGLASPAQSLAEPEPANLPAPLAARQPVDQSAPAAPPAIQAPTSAPAETGSLTPANFTHSPFSTLTLPVEAPTEARALAETASSPAELTQLVDPAELASSAPALPADLDLPQIEIGPVVALAEQSAGEAIELLGNDPAGGIATLVSLVSITDIIDLNDVLAPDSGVVETAGDPGLSMLDALADDLVTVDPLAAESDDTDGDSAPIPGLDAPLPTPTSLPTLDDPLDDAAGGLI